MTTEDTGGYAYGPTVKDDETQAMACHVRRQPGRTHARDRS